MSNFDVFVEQRLSKFSRERDREIIRLLLDKMRQDRNSEIRQRRVLDFLAAFAKKQNRSLDELDIEDIKKWMYGEHQRVTRNGKLVGKPYYLKPRSFNNYRDILRNVYKMLLEEDKADTFLKPLEKMVGAAPAIAEDEILTEEERFRAVRAAKTLQHQCMIAILADTGARISEVLKLRFCDIKPYEDGRFRVVIQTSKMKGEGKSPRRENPLYMAIGYVRLYLASFDKDILNSEELLFPMKYHNAYLIIKQTGIDAGIKDRKLHPHAYRHAVTTEDIESGMSGPNINALRGWSPKSNMMYLYAHPKSSKAADILDSTRGVAPPQKADKSISKCPQCQENVVAGAVFCMRCGIPLGPEGKRAIVYDQPLIGELIEKVQRQNALWIKLYEALMPDLPPELAADLELFRRENEFYEEVRRKIPKEEPIF